MRKIPFTVLVVLVLLSYKAYAKPFTDWIDSIPDITQTDPKALFPFGGVHYCGPCAISNSLVWLGENGYEKLLPEKRGDQLHIQAELTKIIASEKYMDTTLQRGTSPRGILQGVSKYLHDCGYEYSELSYEGWREVPNQFNTGVKKPRLDWIESGLKENSAVWLNVGWYMFSPETREYTRVGGHWVTLAGFGVDKNGKENSNILIIHDPGARSGYKFSNDFARAARIRSGKLVGGGGRTQDASGFFKLLGMKFHPDIDAAILDGAIRLSLKAPKVISASKKEDSRKKIATQ